MLPALTRSPRILGALLAAALGLLASFAQVASGLAIDPRNPATLIVPTTVPLGVVLALRHAIRVVRSERLRLATIVVIAAQGVLAGALLVAAITALTDAYGPLPADVGTYLARVFFFAAYGVVLLGVPLFGLTVGYAAVWAGLIRRLSRQAGSTGADGALQRADGTQRGSPIRTT